MAPFFDLIKASILLNSLRPSVLADSNVPPKKSTNLKSFRPDRVTIPIIKAIPLIKSIVHGGQMVTDSGLSFFKHRDQFRVVVDGSRSRSGDIFLDTDLLTLVAGNNFQKTSNTMVAMVDEKSITNFVNILQNKHHLSITITGQQFKQVEDNVVPLTDRYKPIRLPPPTDDSAERKAAAQDHKKDDQRPTAKIISLLELEAEALELELQLLAA